MVRAISQTHCLFSWLVCFVLPNYFNKTRGLVYFTGEKPLTLTVFTER